jgi:quercetin dioxygenase-like cupin family protein
MSLVLEVVVVLRDRKECATQIDRPGRDSERGPAEQFTGSVWTDVIAAPSQSSPVAVCSVHFAPGARTAWPAHPAGQVLHVTEDAGLVQVRGQRGDTVRGQRPEEIRAGDTVRAGPGEWHWHGAGVATFMTHLAVQQAEDGAVVEWGDLVAGEYPA